MGLPPNVRVNAQLPFPAMVTGGAGIAISKNNGIWQVSFSINGFGSQNPPSGNFATDFLLGYDAIAQTFFKVSIANLIAVTTSIRLQRRVTATPIIVSATDQILNCNISSGAASCTLPSYATRGGLALTFKDVGGQAAANNITITPNGAETIDGVNAAVVLRNNYEGITLVPANDGTSTGWSIE